MRATVHSLCSWDGAYRLEIISAFSEPCSFHVICHAMNSEQDSENPTDSVFIVLALPFAIRRITDVALLCFSCSHRVWDNHLVELN